MTTSSFIAAKAGGPITGILAMLGAMASFVANDTCVKLIGDAIPLGELILLRSVGATALVLIYAQIAGGLRPPPRSAVRLIGWRVAADILATLCIVAGVLGMAIADATAISQLTPLVMTAAAAVLLRERVGWRRWLAIFIGFAGVMLIIRPGTASFSTAAVLSLAGVVFVVARDLVTRRIGAEVTTLTLLCVSLAASSLAGLLLLPFETWIMPPTRIALLLALCSLFVTFAYALIIVAVRNGDVATTAPFRYAVIIFALLSGYLFWGELPDALQVLGIAILTAAGVYTFHRERVAAAKS